jgi:hypothetical protein
LQLHLRSFCEETLIISAPLVLAGLASSHHYCRHGLKAVLAIMLVFYLVFFNSRANLDVTNTLLLGVQERFWLQPNMVTRRAIVLMKRTLRELLVRMYTRVV